MSRRAFVVAGIVECLQPDGGGWELIDSHGAGIVGAGDTAGDKRQPPVPPVTTGSVSWQLSVFGFRAPAVVLNWILNHSL